MATPSAPVVGDISGQDNPAGPPQPENWPVDLREARRRIAERAELHAFISTSSEAGTGTVVAVKDLVDVAGVGETARGRLLSHQAGAQKGAGGGGLPPPGCRRRRRK